MLISALIALIIRCVYEIMYNIFDQYINLEITYLVIF